MFEVNLNIGGLAKCQQIINLFYFIFTAIVYPEIHTWFFSPASLSCHGTDPAALLK